MTNTTRSSAGFPHSVVDPIDRVGYYRTGKTGISNRNGKVAAEYEDGNGRRVWADVHGLIVERDA